MLASLNQVPKGLSHGLPRGIQFGQNVAQFGIQQPCLGGFGLAHWHIATKALLPTHCSDPNTLLPTSICVYRTKHVFPSVLAQTFLKQLISTCCVFLPGGLFFDWLNYCLQF